MSNNVNSNLKAKTFSPEVNENNGGSYSVKGRNMNNFSDMKAAEKELKIRQSNILFNYKDWAKQNVSYVDMSRNDAEKQAELAQKLKANNDAYTVSYITNALMPLADGITLSSVASSWASMKVIKMMNPDFDLATSRMCENFRDALGGMANSSIGKALYGTDSGFGRELVLKSTQNMNKSVENGMNNGTLDSLVMTPKQLAAIKLNFMEQYYADTRSLDPTQYKTKAYQNDIETLTQQYDTAMSHLKAIAENSGYDMSVVAAEERQMIGIKAKHDPSYLNIFNETESVYGVKMDDSTYSNWTGNFKMADGGEYNAEFGNKDGSFTVRLPICAYSADDKYHTKDPIQEYKDSLRRHGEEYAYMIKYTQSDACPLRDADKKQAINLIKEQFESYKQNTIIQLQDDFGYSKKQATSFYDNTFGKGYKDIMSIKNMDAFDNLDKAFCKEGQKMNGMDFYRELEYTTEKRVYSDLGYNIAASGRDNLISRNMIIDKLKNYSENEVYANTKSGDKDRTKAQMGVDITKNYIADLSASDYARLMLHVGNNMEQAVQYQKSYNRFGDLPSEEKTKKTSHKKLDRTVDVSTQTESLENTGDEPDI